MKNDSMVLHDGFWMWGHDSGVYDGPDGIYKIPLSEPIGMAHACGYMDIPNVCAVRWERGDELYMGQFRNMRRFSWVVTGHNDESFAKLSPFALNLADSFGNFTAFELDDFFHSGDPVEQYDPLSGKAVQVTPAFLTLEQLHEFRQKVTGLQRSMEIRVVLYARQLRASIVPALQYVDTVLLWTWDGADISKLKSNFKKYRELAPEKKTLLGIYMWDFGGRKPLEMTFMKDQLAAALEFWKNGDIDGMIFHCTPLVNKNLEAVEYCRQWIMEHKNERR